MYLTKEQRVILVTCNKNNCRIHRFTTLSSHFYLFIIINRFCEFWNLTWLNNFKTFVLVHHINDLHFALSPDDKNKSKNVKTRAGTSLFIGSIGTGMEATETTVRLQSSTVCHWLTVTTDCRRATACVGRYIGMTRYKGTGIRHSSHVVSRAFAVQRCSIYLYIRCLHVYRAGESVNNYDYETTKEKSHEHFASWSNIK